MLEHQCPSRAAIELISGKWALLLIPMLASGPLRNNELLRRCDGISQKVLTETLKQLTRNGLVCRESRDSVPPHVEYRLSELGQSLSKTLVQLDDWVQSNLEAVRVARLSFDTAPS